MKKILHISDLHFGREDVKVVAALLQDIHNNSPDVVVVSGDLTQRARRRQFLDAAKFLEQITFPKIIVPGNHDVPLYDVSRRFLTPFNRYIRYINEEFYPTYKDDTVTIIGINTAYSFTWKSGRISKTQLEILKQKFKDDLNLKILVIHHPYHEIFYKKKNVNLLLDCGIDVILSGHLHRASARILTDHVSELNLKTLIVQAGTSVSTRLRGESNSYNLIEVNDKNKLVIHVMEYANLMFKKRLSFDFVKQNDVWCLSP